MKECMEDDLTGPDVMRYELNDMKDMYVCNYTQESTHHPT